MKVSGATGTRHAPVFCRWCGKWLLGLASAALLWPVSLSLVLHAQVQEPSEYEVKAAFLFNFAKFVDWPPPPGDERPLSICVLGRNPFGSSLEKIAQGKSVSGRPLVIRYIKNDGEARACEIVFVSKSEQKRFRAILDGVRGVNVLTVADTEGFAEMGGVVNFVLRNGRVRFEINIAAAKAQGLKISSKLLSLAEIVRNGSPGG